MLFSMRNLITRLKIQNCLGVLFIVCAYSSSRAEYFADTENLSCGHLEKYGKIDLSRKYSSLKDNFKRDVDNEKYLDRYKTQVDCVIPITQAQRLKNAIFLDVRSSIKFNKSHIPDSINLKLHLIDSRGFLKDKSIVLVGEQFNYFDLIQQCNILDKDGFNEVYVLKNGFSAWELSNSKQGEYLSFIAVKEFESLKRKSNWLVFDFSENTLKAEGQYYNFNLSEKDERLRVQLNSILAKFNEAKKQMPNVLLVDLDGSKLLKIAGFLSSQYRRNVFAFHGGLKEYEKEVGKINEIVKGKEIASSRRKVKCR